MKHSSHTRPRLVRTALASAAAGFIGTAVLMGGITGYAQSIASHDSRAPVSFDAARIEWQDRQNRVVLTGDVRVVQAGLSLQSARMLLEYDDAGELRIDRLTASGGVDIARGNERASGDSAVYDFNRRVITMAGNVRLRRGGDTLNGGRLVIDLQSGLSSIDGAPTGTSTPGSRGKGRVTGTFAVPQGKQD